MGVKKVYWSIAALMAAVWTAYMELLGPGGLLELIPAGTVIAAAAVGSSLSGRLAEKLLPYATNICERGQVKRVPLDVAEEMGQHVAMGAAISASYALAGLPTLLRMGFGLHMLLLSLVAAPVAPLAVYYLGWSNRVGERKERTDWELPFFTVYATILAHCGLTLYASMKLLAKGGRRLFRQMAAEAEDVERMAELTGRGVVESLETHAASHPHEGFQSLIYSTTSVWRMGGSMVSALEDRATEFLKSLEERYDRYAVLVSAVMESFIILLLLLPMGLVLAAITSPGQAGPIISMMTIGVIPSTGIMMYAFIRAKSPRHLDDISFRPQDLALAALAGAATAVPLIAAGAPQTVAFTIPAAVSCLVFWLRMRPAVKELRDTEAEVRRWLKDIAEYRRLGHPPVTAVMKTLSHAYRPSFKKLIEHIAGRVSMGLTIWEAGAGVAKSWLFRMSLYLLHAINMSGGGSPYLMEKLVELLRSYNLSKEKAAGRIAMFKYLAIAMPLITALTIGMVLPIANLGGIFQVSEAGAAVAGAGGIPFAAITPDEMLAVADSGMVMIAIGGLLFMMIISRAVDGHPYNTWRAAVVMAVTAASYYLMVPIGDMMLSLMRWE